MKTTPTTPADTTTTPTTPRSLSAIAAEIRANWPKVYFGAVPYLRAMGELDTVADYYGADDARGIVAYFLSNATTWKGDVARRVKAELKHMAGIR